MKFALDWKPHVFVAMSLVVGSLNGMDISEEPFVCSNELVTVVFDAKGAVVKRLLIGGEEWSVPGMESFKDRLFVARGRSNEISESLFSSDWEYVGSTDPAVCVFTRLTQALSGLRVTKTYRLGRPKDGLARAELVARVEIKNLGDKTCAFSPACGLGLLPPAGKATLRMPTEDGFKDSFCPGDIGDAFAAHPATCAFGVFDEKGSGYALVAQPGFVSGFYSWKGPLARQATAEWFGNEVRLKPGKSFSYMVKLSLADNIPALLASGAYSAGEPQGVPSSHIRVWTEPGTLKSKTIREGPRPFRRTYDLDLDRGETEFVYALDLDDTDSKGLAVYPRLNGRTEHDRPLPVEAVRRSDGAVRLLVRVPARCVGDKRDAEPFHGHLVWEDPSAKLLQPGTIREKPRQVLRCVPRPFIEIAREKLEKDFRIPLDLLAKVDVSNPPYGEPWFVPNEKIDILYLLQPGGKIISNGKWVLSSLAAMQPLAFRTLVVLPEVQGTVGNKPYSVYQTLFGDRIDDWSVESLKLVKRMPRVAVVQNLDFSIVQPEVLSVFERWNAAGIGFVLLDCPNVPAAFLGERCEELEAGLLTAFPVSSRRQKALAVHRKGEILNVALSLETRKNPAASQRDRSEHYPVVGAREFPHVEYALLAAAKAVRLAAGLKTRIRFESFSKGVLRLGSDAACVCTVEGEFRSREGILVRKFARDVKVEAGGTRLPLDLTELPEGVHVIRLRLVADGVVTDAAAFSCAKAESICPAFAFTQTNRIYRADERLKFDVLLASVPEGTEVSVEVEDTDFRIVRRAVKPAAACVPFAFDFPACPAKIYRVFASVRRDGVVLARKMDEVSVRLQKPDFKDTSAYITVSPSVNYVLPLLKEIGFDYVICGFATGEAPATIRNCAELGMCAVPRNCAAASEWFRPYRGDNPGGAPVRSPCFSSDSYRKELADRIRERAAACKYDFYNVRLHWLGDECFLGSTVCYSPSCLKAFRAELAATYGTIDSLNAEWESAFKAFDEVMPCQLSELRSRDNLAPWLDHKMHMCRSFAANWIGGAKDVLNEVSPGSACGPTGTQKGGHGFDWAELMKHIDAIGYYDGCQRKLIHDFADAYGRGVLAGQCGGGYTDAQFDFEPYNYSTMWSGLLNGSNLAYHYYGAAIDGDMTMTSNMLYWATSMRELKGGIGKLFLASEEPCEVAALHSQNSLFVAMGTEGVTGWHSSQSSWWRILSDLKIPFRYVTREMLEKGIDTKYRVLVMPAVHALSEKERISVCSFLRRGGRVVADLAPGRFDEHGRLVTSGPLSGVGIDVIGADLAEYESVDLGGAAGENASVVGVTGEKGRELRRRVSAALERAGIRPFVSVRDAKGAEYPCTAVWREDGPNGVFAMHLEPQGNKYGRPSEFGTLAGRFDFTKGDAVIAHLPRKAHVYDIRAREYVGFTDTIKTTLIPGYTRIYAVLDKRPGEITVAGADCVICGETARFAFAVAGTTGAQTFHAELIAPDGARPVAFRRNFRCEDGRGEYVFETAFNEKPGAWTLEVRHANTGRTVKRRIEVKCR